MDDIPEAVRNTPRLKPTSPTRSPLLLGGGVLLLGVVGLLSILLLFRSTPKAQVESSASPVSPEVPSTSTPNSSPKLENVLGHLPYQEAPASELKPVTPDGRIRLRVGAAEKFKQMQTAARADGIILNLISGFRSVKEQEYLFFGVKEQRNQETKKRAEVSAPPGYSEHHTGYAFDVGDGKVPSANLNTHFENTPAFRWLKNNAAKYSFELSFPRNNPQGVSYEPWHWRFVGDRKSLETFYKAEQLKTRQQEKTNN
ncbi:M15 family metallopeptidase [Gloeothece verrucosa]|uniref:Peptidase M15B and M15C DD-carboxypeptidase VanY/endolysin n=1 Tax=Gloeothece verrucosa (strain PCC 7822) TaxID=497965 RepID=E0U8Y1_GLOV7|nr:M15 family metallopeptidase [Gloeothece verrucosa]ADN16120.1 peptidase M15B and M15C DD-carboxypeptidase VanY/endolysin [Gloeothece verrucosa PCC 7822]